MPRDLELEPWAFTTLGRRHGEEVLAKEPAVARGRAFRPNADGCGATRYILHRPSATFA